MIMVMIDDDDADCTLAGASADESAAQKRGHGDEGGLPETAREDLPQDLHPAARQRQVTPTDALPFYSLCKCNGFLWVKELLQRL